MKRDSFVWGMLLGVGAPVVVYGMVLALHFVLWPHFDLKKVMLLCFAVNIFPIRYYFKILKAENSALGVFMATFIYIMLFFLLVHTNRLGIAWLN